MATYAVKVGKLIYSAITSLDGYVEDEAGNFDWAAPDQEEHGSSTTPSGRSAPISTGAQDVRGDGLDVRRFGNGVVHLHYCTGAVQA